MKITNEMIEFAEKQNWDEDMRQETYLALLAKPDDYMKDAGVKALMTAIYNFRTIDEQRQQTRRRELVEENIEVIQSLHSTDETNDPIEDLMVDDLIGNMEDLSPLLYNTLQDYVSGMTVTEIAEKHDTTENNVYQRIHAIKQELHNGE